ncbi:MAG TPA: hypothetical protein VFQ45_13920 [Longimicrobium sp.]|nr:hypothetical protein [Longimicrobium sp.]
MPYTLSQAANPMAIAECEWGTAGTIQFTAFTSCLGVVAKVTGQNNVIGIHLVMVDGHGNTFGTGDVARVTGVLANQHYDNTTCHVIGATGFWQHSASAAYNALIAALNHPTVYTFGDGTYGATITGGAVEITY